MDKPCDCNGRCRDGCRCASGIDPNSENDKQPIMRKQPDRGLWSAVPGVDTRPAKGSPEAEVRIMEARARLAVLKAALASKKEKLAANEREMQTNRPRSNDRAD